ncbi:MAG: homogentisate 1,2-dioxygenase [Frankiales bacterium]|nr:homogentisate 1,2-dioxygenase [Frankiales bacterium]
MYYSRQGSIPDKPFTVLVGPGGGPVHEELVTSVGFTGPSSLVYHLEPSTEVSGISLAAEIPLVELEASRHRNHLVEVGELHPEGTFATARLPVFFNDAFGYSVCRPTSDQPALYRNALCDELLVVVSGGGRLVSAFGSLAVGPLDLLYVPRGATVSLEDLAADTFLVVIESSSPITPPLGHLRPRGQLDYNGLYTERDLRIPLLQEPRSRPGPHHVYVKTGTELMCHSIPNDPFDAVGWDGTLYPYALNMTALSPVSGHTHTTPDVYAVFQSAAFMISAIVPLRQPDHEHSTSAQPDHSSDCDEIFHRFAKPTPHGYGSGAVTLHTRSSPHGPSRALKARDRRERTTGYGVILDVFAPLRTAATAGPGDVRGYHG